jgi:hypothetical protein
MGSAGEAVRKKGYFKSFEDHSDDYSEKQGKVKELKDQLVVLKEAIVAQPMDPTATTVEAANKSSAALRAKTKADLKIALEAIAEATTQRDKAAADMFQLYAKPSVRRREVRLGQDCPGADRGRPLPRPPRRADHKGAPGNVTQVFRGLCHVPPSHRVPQQRGRAGEVLHHERAEETPACQHLSVCAACGAAQLLRLTTALLVLQPKRQGQHHSHERALRRG